ncbi:hypothetical protein JVT61DRAFT_3891 [Boletus reticuloceps]|uniref:Transcription factor Aft1 osmotic stress domain-containing protein n=1 Tax=Boletus reticuloceps TaxID=495285 RepID=A0A8I2YNF3_9AGAM|nr:hypothetical protein JVT61DRAFT_3891 [Boletus reticuloceps]
MNADSPPAELHHTLRHSVRQTRSDFDLEPNPFEQSFSRPSHIRHSSASRRDSASPASNHSSRASLPDRPPRHLPFLTPKMIPAALPHAQSSPSRCNCFPLRSKLQLAIFHVTRKLSPCWPALSRHARWPTAGLRLCPALTF